MNSALILVLLLQVPSLPVPGAPSVDTDSIAVQSAEHVMGPYVAQKTPIILDAAHLYPLVPAPPGGPFHGTYSVAMQNHIAALLRASRNGVIDLPPGDYVYRVYLMCTDETAHGASQNMTFALTPLEGERAPALIALNDRASQSESVGSDLQVTSWAIQSGASYSEFNDTSQQLVDRYIPEYKDLLSHSTVDEIQQEWESLDTTIPGLPSLDDAVGQMGPTGQQITDIEVNREAFADHGQSYASLYSIFVGNAGLPAIGQPSTPPPTPWSKIAPRWYVRLMTTEAIGGTGDFQIRVTGTTDPPGGLGGMGALPRCWDTNTGGWAFGTKCTQPLTGSARGNF